MSKTDTLPYHRSGVDLLILSPWTNPSYLTYILAMAKGRLIRVRSSRDGHRYPLIR
jgi:hypothetical protein